MANINATIKQRTNHGNTIAKYRKENNYQESLQLIVASYSAYNGVEMRKLIDCRIYRTDSRHYCCIWINDNKTSTYLAGGGMTQGHGYHRPSAAMQAALDNTGISLDCPIDSRGDSAMEDALTAIARALGYSEYLVVKAHG